MKLLSKETTLNQFVSIEDEGKDIPIVLKANSDGFVYWCSHWEHIEDLVSLGVVLKSQPGPLHHYDFYLPMQALVTES